MVIWKDIIWYEWLYQISSLGNVKRDERKILCWKIGWVRWIYHKITPSTILKFGYSGLYRNVTLCKDWKTRTFKVNRLVWQAFLWLDIKDKKILVCHKNDIRDDDRVDNLFLWTHKDNMEDCVKKGRIWRMYWEKNPSCKITNIQVKEIIKLIKKWYVLKKIAERYLIDPSVISRIKNWKARIQFN